MKKLIVISLLIAIFQFSSCSNKCEKIYLEQNYQVDSFIYLNSEELISLTQQNKDFVLTIGSYGCESCEIIKPIIIEYIKDNKTPFYWIEHQDYSKAVDYLKNDNYYSLRPSIYSASLLLFDNGQDKNYLQYNDSTYSSLYNFKNKMRNYLDKSGIVNINDYDLIYYLDNTTIMYKQKEVSTMSNINLDKIISENEKVTVVYSWSICPDCTLLYNQFLKNYMEINNRKKIYIYDVSAIKELNDNNSWSNFVNDYSLPNYRGGKVPSIVTYQNTKVISSCVFVNDLIEINNNNLYEVIESFWDEIKGTSEKTLEMCKKVSIQKHIELLKKYLDINL